MQRVILSQLPQDNDLAACKTLDKQQDARQARLDRRAKRQNARFKLHSSTPALRLLLNPLLLPQTPPPQAHPKRRR